MSKFKWIAAGVLLSALAGSAVLWGAGEGNPPHLTDIEEVIMYGVDADTYELLRYEFSTEAFTAIGIVKDQNDNVVPDVEALTLIPNGPHKGLYGAANYYEQQPTRLVKINGLDAKGVVASSPVGFDKVEGLVAVQDPDSSEWSLLAVAKEPQTRLISIDPATGVGTLIMETQNRYQGLAVDTEGLLYAVTQNPARLWTIDLDNLDEELVGDLSGYSKVEALEYAYGDNSPRIKIPLVGHDVVPDSWTMGGVLFGFSDDQDALLIIHATNADSVQWECSFQTIDCEGLVFTTVIRDPYGPVVNTVGD